MLVVRFTKEERDVLLLMIDTAIRAKGLEAAESGFILANRLQNAEPEDE